MVTISALGSALIWGTVITPAHAQQPAEPAPPPVEPAPEPTVVPPEPTPTPTPTPQPEVQPAAPVQTQTAPPPRERTPHIGFAELTASWGFQLGVQDYVPDGTATSYKHPITTGWAFGAIAGWEFLPQLFLIGNYEYSFASSRKGEVENALDEVQGKISYHLATIGLRSTRRLGPGFLLSDFSIGIVFPFETKLEYQYSPALAGLPTPIEGSGERRHEYDWGIGAAAQVGYQLPIVNGTYLSLALRVKSLQTNDNGEKIVLENFVTDFMAPAPADAEIEIEDDISGGAQRPTTYSVQAIRALLAIGYRF